VQYMLVRTRFGIVLLLKTRRSFRANGAKDAKKRPLSRFGLGNAATTQQSSPLSGKALGSPANGRPSA